MFIDSVDAVVAASVYLPRFSRLTSRINSQKPMSVLFSAFQMLLEKELIWSEHSSIYCHSTDITPSINLLSS
jgi:hypothetical protein